MWFGPAGDAALKPVLKCLPGSALLRQQRLRGNRDD